MASNIYFKVQITLSLSFARRPFSSIVTWLISPLPATSAFLNSENPLNTDRILLLLVKRNNVSRNDSPMIVLDATFHGRFFLRVNERGGKGEEVEGVVMTARHASAIKNYGVNAGAQRVAFLAATRLFRSCVLAFIVAISTQLTPFVPRFSPRMARYVAPLLARNRIPLRSCFTGLKGKGKAWNEKKKKKFWYFFSFSRVYLHSLEIFFGEGACRP